MMTVSGIDNANAKYQEVCIFNAADSVVLIAVDASIAVALLRLKGMVL